MENFLRAKITGFFKKNFFERKSLIKYFQPVHLHTTRNEAIQITMKWQIDNQNLHIISKIYVKSFIKILF